MALPTAATPGYGYFYTYTSHPNVACNCLRLWLPKLEQLARHRGILGPTEGLRIIQCTGGASQSSGTHTLGGAWDADLIDPTRWHDATRRDYRMIGPRSLAFLVLAREMGSQATWPRIDVDGRADGDPWENNEHFHGALRGCPHNSRCRYQIDEYDRGEDGLTGSGRDTYPRPKVSRTWEQGIAWANQQMTAPAQEDDVVTAADIAAIAKATASEVHGQLIGRTDVSIAQGIERAYRAGESAAALARAIESAVAALPKAVANEVWYETKVRRGDSFVAVIQEVADNKTMGQRLEAAIATISGALPSLPDDADTARIEAALADLRGLVEESHPKAEPQPEPVPALGIDVSRYQTIAQTAAALAAKPDFCIINATTGLRAVSSALASHTTVAREHADVTGFYHWSNTVNDLATTPDKSDPVGEAAHFLATCKPQPGDVLALDHEEALGTWPQRVAYALAWLDEVKARTGATPLLYVNWSWVKGLRTAATLEQWERLTAYPLWLADPTGTPGQHATVTAKDGSNEDDWPILLHQYAITDGVDRNYCHDLNRLRACAVP